MTGNPDLNVYDFVEALNVCLGRRIKVRYCGTSQDLLQVLPVGRGLLKGAFEAQINGEEKTCSIVIS